MFRSTPSCGGRQALGFGVYRPELFRSTPSCGGRPTGRRRGACHSRFDPHPRAEGDYWPLLKGSAVAKFRSTPSCGGRLAGQHLAGAVPEVSIHTLVRRATRDGRSRIQIWRRFDPHPRAEGDRSPSNAFRSLEKSGGWREPPSSSCQTVPRSTDFRKYVCLLRYLLEARTSRGMRARLRFAPRPLSGPKPRRPARHRRRRWCGALATVSLKARAGWLSSPRANLRRAGRADEHGEAASGKDAYLR